MTVTIIDTVQTLRDELEGILRKYSIPMEERSYIIEKVGGAVGAIASIQRGIFDEKIDEIRKEIGSERQNVRQSIDGIKRAAISQIVKANHKVDEAYDRGLAQGAETIPKGGPGSMGIILGLFFAALAFVVVASNLFKKGEKKER